MRTEKDIEKPVVVQTGSCIDIPIAYFRKKNTHTSQHLPMHE
jgi:hypothetical protein